MSVWWAIYRAIGLAFALAQAVFWVAIGCGGLLAGRELWSWSGELWHCLGAVLFFVGLAFGLLGVFGLRVCFSRLCHFRARAPVFFYDD
jgi:hypothetical protein